MATLALDVDHRIDTGLYEDVVTAADAFHESEIDQQFPQLVKPDVGVRASPNDSEKEIVINRHANSLAIAVRTVNPSRSAEDRRATDETSCRVAIDRRPDELPNEQTIADAIVYSA